MRKRKAICLFIIFLIVTVNGLSAEKTNSYKVLIGMQPEQAMQLHGITTLVIDAEFFSTEAIAQLRKNGNVHIFSYLNIGSIETFRSDYAAFADITLGNYDGWDNEKWINTADAQWHKRIKAKAQLLAQKEIDGFFLDNADVYYHYKTPEIYQGLITMLYEIHTEHKPIIINGGDTFITEAMHHNDLKGVVNGINQESVFTEIHFKTKTFGIKSAKDRAYFMDYLERCKQYGFTVYLLEYGASKQLKNEIARYCENQGFIYDISPSLELDSAF